MPNPNPSPKGQFKKGQQRPPNSGRKPGQLGLRTELLSEALLRAAEELGDIKEEPVLDENGRRTGRFRLVPSGKGGLTAFLKWAALNHTPAFLSQLGRVMPIQVNTKTTHTEVTRYETLEEARLAVIADGWDPDVLEQALRPKFLRQIEDKRQDDDAKTVQ